MKKVSVTVIANKRELDMILEARKALPSEVIISQWSDRPIEYKIELSIDLYNYMFIGRMGLFIN